MIHTKKAAPTNAGTAENIIILLYLTGRDWLLETARQSWQFSDERYNLKKSIERRRNNGECISYGTEQTALTLAQSRYIAEYIRKHQTI